jgi:hypothetical protein
MPSIFLSYRRDDSAGYAGRLRSSLEARLGAGSVFRDVDAIEPGQDFVEAIETRVQACRAFIALIGQEWLDAVNASGGRRLEEEGDYVRREVAAALARSDLRVIPVLVEGATVPGPNQLPLELQALSRRHAVSLRDETWDSDVDRLTDAVRKAVGDAVDQKPARSTRSGRRAHPLVWTAAGALAVIVAIALPQMFAREGTNGDDASNTGDAPADRGTDGSTAGRSDRIRLPPEGITIAVPHLSEIELHEQIYSLVAASLAPRGDSMTLRLRFRTFNDSRYDHALDLVAVRLGVGQERIAPATGLTGLLPGRTVLPADVTFIVPQGIRTAVLHVADRDEEGEFSLDLVPAGPLVANAEQAADESRAVGYPLYFTDEPVLLESEGRRYTLSRVNVRQFVNKHRIAVTAKLDNTSRYPELFGASSFRLALEDGTVLAPVTGDDDVVNAGATLIQQVVFEVPVTTRRIVLRTLRAEEVREFVVELGQTTGG